MSHETRIGRVEVVYDAENNIHTYKVRVHPLEPHDGDWWFWAWPFRTESCWAGAMDLLRHHCTGNLPAPSEDLRTMIRHFHASHALLPLIDKMLEEYPETVAMFEGALCQTSSDS